MEAFSVLPDPQTNGGLLIDVKPGAVPDVLQVFKQFGLEDFMKPIGVFVAKSENVVINVKK